MWLVRVSPALGVLLVAGLLSVLPPASAAPKDPGADCSAEMPDEGAALSAAARCGQIVSVSSLRTEFQEVSANPDGSLTANVSVEPTRTLRDGAWRPVDMALQADGGVVAPLAPPQAGLMDGVEFSPGGTGPMVTLRSGTSQVSMWAPWVLPAPTLKGEKAVYAEVMPHVDLELAVTKGGFSHVLVVKDRAAVESNPIAFERVTFRMSVVDARVGTNDAGGLLITDGGGEPIFVSGSAIMWDSTVPDDRRGPDGMPPRHRPMPLAVAAGDDVTEVTVVPDLGLLTSPETVYPVYIDPTVTIQPPSWWTHANSCYPTTVYWGATGNRMNVGREWGTPCIWRSFMQFDLYAMRGAVIEWAGVDVTADHTAACNGSYTQLWRSTQVFTPESAAWNNTNHWISSAGGAYFVQEELFSANEDTACPKGDDPGSFGDGPMRVAVHSVANYPETGYKLVLGLRSPIENDQMGWTYFHPNATLTVSYRPNNNPLTPDLVKPTGDCYPSCTDGSKVRTSTPTIQARVVDPEARPMAVTFEVRRTADWSLVASTTKPDIASGSIVTWITPSLANATTYLVRVESLDPFGGPSGWGSYTFTVDTAGPDTPSGVGVSSVADCYVSCNSPAVLRSARPTFKATVPHPFGDVLSVQFEVLDSSSTVVVSTTRTNVPAGTTPTWQPGSNLPQGSLRLRVRSQDQYARWSSWTPFYEFAVDTSAPVAPAVSSPVYRHKDTGTWNGGIGVPGSFTVTPNASTDVRVFEWRINQGTPTPVNVAAGASATFTIIPTADLELLLEVRSIDQAGWTSGWTPYPFLVRSAPVDVGYWKFDESSGFVAAAATGGSDFNGARIGGSAWVTSGISPTNPGASGNAASLNGTSDYVQTPRLLATNHAAGFSVSAWVKPTDLTGVRTVAAGAGGYTDAFRLYHEAGHWCFTVAAQDSLTAATHTVCSDATALVGAWTHLVGVYDPASQTVRLYVNGGPFNNVPSVPRSADQATAPASMWPATGYLRVGRSSVGQYWHGLVDEVRVYQRALPEVEARHLFLDCWQEGCPPVPEPTEPVHQCSQSSGPPCVGQWLLDDGAGTAAADGSALGNPLVLTGGAAWTANGYNGTTATSLDGASGRLSTQDQMLLTDQSFTVSAWVRLDQLLDTDQIVMQAGGTDASSFELLHTASDDRWRFVITSHDGVSVQWHTAVSSQPVVTGTWTHLMGVYDAADNEVRLFVNGLLDGVGTGASGQPTLTGLSVGAHSGGAAYLDGTIDLVGAYQGAFSAEQAAALYAEQAAPPELRARYELEEWNSQAYDYSENGNHATVTGGAQWTDEGYDGSSAITFDGASGELTTAGPVLTTTDSYSLAAWANLSDTTAEHTLVSQDGSLTSAFGLISTASGQWCLRVTHTDTAAASSTQACGGTAQTGVWTHVAGVYDAAGRELRLYVNGTLVATQPFTSSTFDASGAFVVGRARVTPSGGPTASSSYFAGTIDGVRAYQGALSDTQIAAVYNNEI